MSFGLDGRVVRRPSRTDDLINREVFIKSVYVPRPQLEDLLRSHLGTDKAIWLQGTMGSGKTSLVYRMLFEYNAKHALPLIVADFRVDVLSEPDATLESSDEDKAKPVKTASEIKRELEARTAAQWMRLLKQRVLDAVSELRVSRAELALQLLDEHQGSLRSLATTEECSDCLQALADEFLKAQTSGALDRAWSMRDWAKAVLKRDSPVGNVEHAERLLDKLGQSLGTPELLFCIGARAGCRVIVLIDNLDNITDTNLRAVLRAWFKTTAEQLKDHAQFVMCVRPENRRFFKIDRSAPAHPDEMPTFNEGTHLQYEFQVKPPEEDADLAAGFEDYLRAHPLPRVMSDVDADGGQVLTPAMRSLIFDSMIISKRIELLKQIALNPTISVEGVSREDMAALALVYQEVLDIRSVRTDTLCLSNGNKRAMFAAAVNLIEHLVVEENLEWDQLGRRLHPERGMLSPRQFTVFSLYYRWISSQLGTFNQTRSFSLPHEPKRSLPDGKRSCFELVDWVNDAGWEGTSLYDAAGSLSKRIVSALAPHYVLLGLYNLSENSLWEKNRAHVEVRKLCDICQTIGVPPERTCRYLTELIRSGSVFEHGIIESSVFMDVYKGNHEFDKGSSETVWLTDRGIRLLEMTGAMFSYNAPRVAKGAVKAAGGASALRQVADGLVVLEEADKLLAWLRRAITCEIHVVYALSGGKRPSVTDIDTYKGRFCINANLASHSGSLWSHRLVRSSLGYLEHVHNAAKGDEYRSELWVRVSEFQQLSEELSQRLASHANWDLVPRNRAFGK